MPSRSECQTYFQDHRLTNAISKRIGWYALANELGLPIKKSETLLGKTFESAIADLLESKGFSVQQMSQNFPYDLLVDDFVKIDVKTSRLYKGKAGDFYTFNLEKPYATCDVFILVALGDSNSIERVMIVPSKFVFKNTQISVGKYDSKYHRFTDRYDYIEDLSEFWRKVA
jgi:hypothetical protein